MRYQNVDDNLPNLITRLSYHGLSYHITLLSCFPFRTWLSNHAILLSHDSFITFPFYNMTLISYDSLITWLSYHTILLSHDSLITFPFYNMTLLSRDYIITYLYPRLDAVVGPVCSGACSAGADFLQIKNYPMISWDCTQPDLSNKPNFLRTVSDYGKVNIYLLHD